MSDTGVFASRYAHLRRIGDLLDSVLLQARSHSGSPNAIANQLADLLEQTARTRVNPLQELALLLRDRPQMQIPDLGSITARLREGDLSTLVLEQLEMLARSIDARLSETAAQMRGFR